MTNKTPQRILQEAREELGKKFDESFGKGLENVPVGKNSNYTYGTFKSFSCDLSTSTLQAFLEAEIERLKGIIINTSDEKDELLKAEGYSKAIDTQISHLKELLETLKR